MILRHAIKKRPLLSSLKERDEKDKALLITKAGVQQTLKELRKMHKQFESMTHMVKDNIDQINEMAGDGKTEIDAFLFTHGHGDLDKKLEAEKKKKLTAAKKKNDEGAVINIGETKKKTKIRKYAVAPGDEVVDSNAVHENFSKQVSKGLMKVDKDSILEV